MMTTMVDFKDVVEGQTFAAWYGEHGQKREAFRKTTSNMGRCLDGDWPMPFQLDEKVEVEFPNTAVSGGAGETK